MDSDNQSTQSPAASSSPSLSGSEGASHNHQDLSVSNQFQDTGPTASQYQPPSEQTGQVNAQMTSPPKAKKNGKKLVIGIILGIFLLLVLPMVILMFLLSAANIQSSSVSSNFMTAITTGDIDKALVYTDGTSDTRKFLDSIAPKVKADKFTKKDYTKQQSRSYFLYSLEGALDSTARTTVEKTDQGYRIVGFVSGADIPLMVEESKEQNGLKKEVASTNIIVSSLALFGFGDWRQTMYDTITIKWNLNIHSYLEHIDYSSNDSIKNTLSLMEDPAVDKLLTIQLDERAITSQVDSDFIKRRA